MFIESQQDQQKKKMGRPRKYDEDFRRTALERMKACEDVSALAGELGVSRPQLYRWRNEAPSAESARLPCVTVAGRIPAQSRQ